MASPLHNSQITPRPLLSEELSEELAEALAEESAEGVTEQRARDTAHAPGTAHGPSTAKEKRKGKGWSNISDGGLRGSEGDNGDSEPSDTADFDVEYAAKLERVQRSAQALREYLQHRHSPGAHQHSPGTRQPSQTEQPSQSERMQPFHGPEEDRLHTDFSGVRGKSFTESFLEFGLQVFRQPQVFAKHYASFAGELVKIVKSQSSFEPERGDRRFRDAVWQDNMFYRAMLQAYLAWDKELRGLLDELEFPEEKDRARSRFIFEQMSAALAPSNSPLNPVAVKRAYQTGGKSVVAGLQNMLRDFADNHGMPRQISTDAYEVGVDLGNSKGAVVYRNPLFELIQYSCEGKSAVHQRPVLIVPPQINKFYVFDLSPRNSIVQHLLQQGLQVFIVSWKNPSRADAAMGLGDYLVELDKGVQAVLDISKSRDLSVVSACAGGITAVSLQALYSSRGESIIRNHSLLVTALDVQDHPFLDLFLTQETVAASLERSQSRGVMEGKELAHVFAWLRPTDLVWSYWINNNLLGKEPPTMDVLYWDNDSTRLPAALHRDFVDILCNDRFTNNSLHLLGNDLDISSIKGDFYFLAGEGDYLMPWKNCYRNLNLFRGAHSRFVLSNSGHIQSVLRPPGIGSSLYFTGEDLPEDSEAWLQSATQHKGTWWDDWSQWLTSRSESLKDAPQHLGNERYPPLCPSPGTYVLER